MSPGLAEAKQLIYNGHFDTAKTVLHTLSDNVQALYLLSLLHRYDDEYVEEQMVVRTALAAHGGNQYMQERLTWHALPLFNRVVPRQLPALPRDPKTTPTAETLDTLCFVTGADSTYFNLMVECIESIHATRLYTDVPICILDCGLTNGEKHYLQTQLRIHTVRDMTTCFDLRLQGLSASLFARAYLPTLFPGYQYYFFLDADTWVHDERAIDRYLQYACYFGLGGANESGSPSARENVKCLDYPYCFLNILPNKYLDVERLRDLPLVNGGLWCMRQDLFARYQFYMQECVGTFGLQYFTDMAALHAVMLERNITDVLSIYDNYQIPKHQSALPLCDENNSFYAQQNRQPVGLIHLTPNAPNIGYTGMYALDAHSGQRKQVSYHYRTWPWKDKPQIRQTLLRESVQ